MDVRVRPTRAGIRATSPARPASIRSSPSRTAAPRCCSWRSSARQAQPSGSPEPTADPSRANLRRMLPPGTWALNVQYVGEREPIRAHHSLRSLRRVGELLTSTGAQYCLDCNLYVCQGCWNSSKSRCTVCAAATTPAPTGRDRGASLRTARRADFRLRQAATEARALVAPGSRPAPPVTHGSTQHAWASRSPFRSGSDRARCDGCPVPTLCGHGPWRSGFNDTRMPPQSPSGRRALRPPSLSPTCPRRDRPRSALPVVSCPSRTDRAPRRGLSVAAGTLRVGGGAAVHHRGRGRPRGFGMARGRRSGSWGEPVSKRRCPRGDSAVTARLAVDLRRPEGIGR